MNREEAAWNTAGQPGRQRRQSLARWLAYFFALACLVWVLYDIHPEKAFREVTRVKWTWVSCAILFDVLSYVVHGVRWKLLLTPFERVRTTPCVRAVFAGLFANEILPLRSGELLRTYVLSREVGISFALLLTSIGVERLLDGLVAAAALALIAFYVPVPHRFERAAFLLGGSLLAVVVLLVATILYLEYHPVGDPAARRGFRKLLGKLRGVLEGLRAMGTARSFYSAILTSLLIPFLQVLALWSMMHSYGLRLPFLAGALVLLVINLGVALPNAPANVGSYQFFCVLGLSVFGVEKTTAAGFSIYAFVFLTIPFLMLGFVALLRSGLSPAAMREQMRRLLKDRRKSEPEQSQAVEKPESVV